jgi:uncharacterized protein YndB with AHSA1/START domain
MGELRKQATVPVPPATVYDYVANVYHAPHYIAAIREITSGPQGPPAVGTRFGASAEFMGSPTQLSLRVLELVPPQRVVLALEGRTPATLTMHLTPVQGGAATRVEVVMDVPSVAGFLLGMTMGSMLDTSLVRLAQAFR